MAKQQILLFLLVVLLSSCSVTQQIQDTERQLNSSNDEPKIKQLYTKALRDVEPPSMSPIVAIYQNSFTDQTGQRASNSQFALFSTALTQAPNALLIRAVKNAAQGKFFRVVERVGLDNLTKERQLIRSAREQYKQKDNPLQPLLFAGVLFEGAVIGYDSNLTTGGSGARFLGVGRSQQYRQDDITVSLRMVSVATGEILLDVLSQKTVFSYATSDDIFIFIDMNTELLELEAGNTRNESKTVSLMIAIEGAVLELINQGFLRGYWSHD